MGLLPPALLILALFVGLSFKVEGLASADEDEGGSEGRDNSRIHSQRGVSALTGTSHLIQKIVSSVVLAAGLYVILSERYTATDAHWAYAAMGIIAGCWLRRKSRFGILN